MTKSTARKWARANRMYYMYSHYGKNGRPVFRATSAGRYPESIRWAVRQGMSCVGVQFACMSLALDGLSVKDLP